MSAKRRESGFTLVELLVALAISSTVLTLFSTVLFQFFSTTGHGHDSLAVLHDHDIAFGWLNRDAQMAVPELATVTASGVTLNWSDEVAGTTYQACVHPVGLGPGAGPDGGRDAVEPDGGPQLGDAGRLQRLEEWQSPDRGHHVVEGGGRPRPGPSPSICGPWG